MIRCADSCSAAALARVRAGFRSAAWAAVIHVIAARRPVRVTASGRMTAIPRFKAVLPYTDSTVELVSFEPPNRAPTIQLDEPDARILAQARHRASATRIRPARAERIDEHRGARGPHILQLHFRAVFEAIQLPIGPEHAGREAQDHLLATLIFASDGPVTSA